MTEAIRFYPSFFLKHPKTIFKVISRETIKPSDATLEHLRYLRASLFDHVNIPMLMPGVFFFSPKKNASITVNSILDRLEGSLRDTLSVFYSLAGRVKDTNYIACNDEGVPYVEAKVIDACLEDIVHKADVDQLDLFLPFDGQEGYTKLLLVIQVTTFPCGGVVIGVKMSHAISNGLSVLMFMKTWPTITNHGKEQSMLYPTPNFEIWKVFPPCPLECPNDVDAPLEPNPDLIEDRPISKRFMFSHVKLDALRTKMYSDKDLSRDNNSLPSLAMVLSSFVRSRCKVVRQGNTSGDSPYEVYYAVNVRPKVTFPEHCYYFGNMVVNALAKPSILLGDNNDDDKENNFCRNFVERVKESVGRIMTDNKFIKDMQEGREDLKFMMEHFEKDSRGEIVSLGFSNLRSLPVYEADFGWGKPVWVTSATLVAKDLILLFPAGPSSNDIEAYINLSDKDMAKLITDNKFKSFVSSTPSAC